MGRRLNLSTPTVINTELIPLDESFYIEANGQTEQWYYDNSNIYAPDRCDTPLTLTPKISVFDADTRTSCEPTFASVRWFANEYNTEISDYKEVEITAVSDGNIDYFKYGNNLIVKKNVSYTRAVTIRCEATYIDPRDYGYTHTIESSVLLTTNRDASVIYPNLDVTCPTSQSYNPLLDETSIFAFNATAHKGDTDVTSSTNFVWYAVDYGQEILANTMPWYVGGQYTSTLVVDAMYGEDIKVILRSRDTSSDTNLHPDKVYRSLLWRIPDVDTTVLSDKGGAVRSSTKEMIFRVICNCIHRVLDDTIKDAHLFFNWKARKNNTTTETDCGWGKEKCIDADALRNVSENTPANTLVYPYVYVAGAYEKVFMNGEYVTHNGEDVYHRPVL